MALTNLTMAMYNLRWLQHNQLLMDPLSPMASRWTDLMKQT
jgi:hypothetical protein